MELALVLGIWAQCCAVAAQTSAVSGVVVAVAPAVRHDMGLLWDGILPYNPLTLIDAWLLGLLVLLPIYYVMLKWSWLRAVAVGRTGPALVRSCLLVCFLLLYQAAAIVWAFQEMVWIHGDSSTIGMHVGRVWVGTDKMHLAGVFIWLFLVLHPLLSLTVRARRISAIRVPADLVLPFEIRWISVCLRKGLVVGYGAILMFLGTTYVWFSYRPAEPLLKACEGGDLAEVKRLIRSGGNPDTTSKKGLRRQGSFVETIVTWGNLPYKWEPGTTPLHLAAKHDHADVVELLLHVEAKADARNRLGSTPLYYASFLKTGRTAGLLLDAGVDPNKPLPDKSPFHIACECGGIEVVRAMLAHGADANRPTQSRFSWGGDKSTPLHLAAYRYRKDHQAVEVIRALVKAGAKLNALDAMMRTPLHRAAMACSPGAVTTLLDLNADTTVRDNNGKLAWDYAQDRHFAEEVLKRLAPRTPEH